MFDATIITCLVIIALSPNLVDLTRKIVSYIDSK
jgi:hypothetical protein